MMNPFLKKSMNQKQIIWIEKMQSNIRILHNQWYYGNQKFRMDELYRTTFNQISTACHRLYLEMPNGSDLAEMNDYWDGEACQEIEVLSTALSAICNQFK